ncbi:MAG TPA: hypothetical protein DCR58_04760 [Idiomarina baltica]|jgi:hypothetical protein|uniref:Uncharacterized protein n=2 Tax=Idiomarina baltica TaxID=190892 RepID=A0A348WNG9_9GAMM|nr:MULTISPECIES: hypothetical protein [unclassified Idiomarina]MEC8925217.1 hypothetical protein [Pseudomonadota bacterium]HAR56081.1 hypothetical protein [Idiomarina baltica]MEC9318690.1 hypothetical protein [Pseudomonadota bacterium]NQZ05204.1 hypothetical protein [Idiomarina sp.]HAE90124.1 hypothetical protein [Idiomarina sp.]|tara:strand:- start:3108 stop:3293 length:186 start_codon:yes stop_codon:yes gene_type:complete
MTMATVVTIKTNLTTTREIAFIDMGFVVFEIEVLLERRLMGLMHVSDRLTDLSQNGKQYKN